MEATYFTDLGHCIVIIKNVPYTMLPGLLQYLGIFHEPIIEENYKAIPLTKDAIVWWLSKYKNNDADEEIIRSFINAVYVNEDQITVFYNYSQNNSTYTSEQFENLSSSDYEMVIPIGLEPTTPTMSR